MRIFVTFFFLFQLLFASGQQDTISVFFDFNSFELSKDELPKIENRTARVLKLVAYTDTVGSERANNKLALNRMETVRGSLKNGIADSAAVMIIGEKYKIPVDYVAADWRRVDVILEITTKPVSQEDVRLAKVNEENESVKDQLVEFLQDTTITEQKIDLTIQFYPGLPIVLPEYEAQLWTLFDFMRYNENVSIEIHGHVCCADDYPLSYQRARMVYEFLQSRTISVKRMTYEGFSNKRPKVSPEVTELDRQQNRRVEVIFRKN